MTYEVKLLSLAERDLDEICQYLSGFYPGTCGRFLDTLEKDFDFMSFNPNMFPKYEYNNEYRKLVTGNFLVFYKIDEKNKRLNVYRILHEKRNIGSIVRELNTQEPE